ncbi:hypothetical protein CFP56_038725 [Quercus suber]|uniref:DUF6469 domain-containing protein n=1 Tax=Quercus suber TaxID=58331 RepID=A0AAW0J1E7_QUESU
MEASNAQAVPVVDLAPRESETGGEGIIAYVSDKLMAATATTINGVTKSTEKNNEGSVTVLLHDELKRNVGKVVIESSWESNLNDARDQPKVLPGGLSILEEGDSDSPINSQESRSFEKSEQVKENLFDVQIKEIDTELAKFDEDPGSYEPEVGDLIALTDFRPKSIDDLDRPTRFYLIAYVYGTKAESSGKLQILASKRIRTEPNMQRNMRETFLGWKRETFPTNKKETILAVYLMNMTTIVRMWRAVNSDLEGGNRNILNKVVQNNAADEENCTTCFSKGKCSPSNSGERLRIDSCDDLRDVFLDYRVNVLRKCFTSSSGWKECLEVVIRFLENPKLEYNIYFEERKKKNVEVEDELKQEESTSNPVKEDDDTMTFEEFVKKKNVEVEDELKQESKESTSNPVKEDDGTMTFEEFVKKKNVEVEDELKQEESTSNPAKEDDHTMTFEEFVKKKFSLIRKSLKCCMIDLCTHLPTSLLPLEVVKDMIRALKLLKSLQTLLCNLSTVANEGLEHVLNDFEDIGSSVGCSSKLSITVKECLDRFTKIETEILRLRIPILTESVMF